MSEHVELRRGAYHDSVTLMQVSRAVGELDGVRAAFVAMATELNAELAAGMGFSLPDEAGPDDLLVAVRTADADALAAARRAVDEQLSTLSAGRAAGGFGAAPPPRTVASAAAGGGGNLALVSVPGRYAFAEAVDALEAGLNVVVFSDNVPVQQEVALKELAARRGLLVMGPDCGTAAVSGVGLGFANVVRPGPVGLVAASGTGAQQLMCLLDEAGVGVSHVLGVGGRDLSADVGARSTLAALAALDSDPATHLVVVVSKPPAPEVAERVRAAAAAMRTPTQLALLGPDQPDLTAVAEQAVAAAGGHLPTWPEWAPPAPQHPRPGALRGLFSGGTLCDEAMLIASAALGRVASNIPLRPDWALPDDLRDDRIPPSHLMIDFGDDRLTLGRAHPMIDPTMRLERLAAEAGDATAAVVLLDVVLGHAADPDPAGALAPAIADARATAAQDGRDLAVVVSLCGTAGDPQGRDEQARALVSAGAAVFASNAAATRHAVALVERS